MTFEQSPNGYQNFGTPQYADSATVLGIAEQIAGENAELMDRLADAPTNDEREALARALFIASDDFAFADRMAKSWDAPGEYGRARWFRYADAILAAGFRRPVQDEPTDSWAGRARRAEAALLRVRDIHIATMEALSETFSAVAVTEQGENRA